MHSQTSSWAHAVRALDNLTLLRPLLDQAPLKALREAADHADPAQAPPQQAVARLLYELSAVSTLWESDHLSFAADPWQAWLIDALISADNPWARLVEQKSDPGPVLDHLLQRDLHLLDAVRPVYQCIAPEALKVANWQPKARRWDPPPHQEALRTLVRALVGPEPWSNHTDELVAFVQKAGAGPFNRAAAFSWDPQSESLVPVRRLDPTRIEDLIGYQRERQKVLDNTERLLQGEPAQHMLLYGDRGTGKSATVKALVHAYQDDGLKLVELSKRHLDSLPRLLEILSQRASKFVLFVDDLSFEGEETEYKELKALLEGSVHAPPQNVKVYATSNRRHLVRESFTDRAGIENNDVRARDTLEETMSLADRFGITVVFTAPGEEEYLAIVRGLAAQRGIDLPLETLEAKALRWARWQNGRTARTARQFIDTLTKHTMGRVKVTDAS